MGLVSRFLFPVLFTSFLIPFPTDATQLFLCDDGHTVLLTDNKELRCPAFDPQAELSTVPDGSTWPEVKGAVAPKLAVSPSNWEPAAGQRSDVCWEWVDLNLLTDGGLDMRSTDNTRKWLALSRIVTATNLCGLYRDPGTFPRF